MIVNKFPAKQNTCDDSEYGMGEMPGMPDSLTFGFLDAENNDNDDYNQKYDTTN